MAVAYGAAGTVVYSTGNPAPSYPAGGTASRKYGYLMFVGTKPDTTPASTPAGWTFLGAVAGGAGSTGIDQGPTRIGVFYRESTSILTGSTTVTVTGNNVSWAYIERWECLLTEDYDWGVTTGADSAGGTSFSVTTASVPAGFIATGDLLSVANVFPTDTLPTWVGAPVITANGGGSISPTTSTERAAPSSSSGQDIGGRVLWIQPTASGVGAGTLTYTQTLSGTTTNAHGPLALVRVRAYTPVTPAITQGAYRFYADGTETGSSALAGENVAPSVDLTSGDVNLAVRLRLGETAGGIPFPATDDWRLQWEKNASGTWTDVRPPAGLLDSYAETNYDGAWPLVAGSVTRIAQTFVGNGNPLSKASFWMNKSGTPDGNVVATLYATSLGAPFGSALATSTTTVASTSLGTTGAWFDFDFDGSFTLEAGTTYAIAVESTNTVASGVSAGHDTSSPTHSGTNYRYSSGVWSPPAGTDLIFRVYTSGGDTAVSYASSNLTDGAATTNRLSAGSGSFVAGKVSEDGLVDDFSWTASNYTEVLYSLTFQAASLVNGDTLRFRVLRNGATTTMTYSQVPTATISAPGGGAPAFAAFGIPL